MNPFGPPVAFPTGASNGRLVDDEEKPHVTNIIHGTWNIVFTWPPPSTLTAMPEQVTFCQPTKLETVLFGCRCREEISDKLKPVKAFFPDRAEVQACELVNEEVHVAEALGRINCECRPTPLGDKIVVLPVNEFILLHYQRLANVTYSRANPNTCRLLFKHLPSRIEIQHAITGLDVGRRTGDVTFRIKEE